ncbi:hypothetical protein [Intestinibacter sp.]|uniref:hypothetical protein n=1 Tax=Intestinibacter sp. TaxID=1965304 RepID=UPI003F13EC16
MNIPKSFKIAGQEITVRIVDHLDDNSYGMWGSATNTIYIANNVDTEYDGKVWLTESHQLNTFFHELIHCFQYYYNNEYSEAEAQVFANFLYEFMETKYEN